MKLIEANRDPNVLIKETERYNIHVRLIKVAVNPADPVNKRSENERIQIFSPKEYDMMIKRHSTPDEWVRIGGFHSAAIVHDGRLEPKEDKPVDEVADVVDELVNEKIREAVKKEVKKRNVRRNLVAK